MTHLDTVIDFDQLFKPRQLDQLFRKRKHPVLVMREHLVAFEASRRRPTDVGPQLEALGNVVASANAYHRKKTAGGTKITNNPKHLFARKLADDAAQRLAEFEEHAERAHANFSAPHVPTTLNPNARQPGARLGTGVRVESQYRFEHYVAKHGPNKRHHGGQFLHDRGIGAPELANMDPMQLYGLIKRYKHGRTERNNLGFLDNPGRDQRRLTPGPNGTVLVRGAPADTFGQIEIMKPTFRRVNGRRVQGEDELKSYTQNVGGQDGDAIYACSVEGDFFVLCDLLDNAGAHVNP